MVDRVRAGNAAATGEVRRRVRRILAFRGYRIPPEDRFDLEQIVLVQLWQAVRRAGFDTSGFWGFVEVLASRRAIDWLRARKPDTGLEPEHHFADPARGPLRLALDREQAELARTVLERLPEGCRELIGLHVRSGRTYAEIAERLGRSEGALRVQMHRCIQRAQRILGELLEAEDDGSRA